MQERLCFIARLSFQLHGHERGRCLTNGAAASGEFDIVESSIIAELHREMNLISARGIIAMHADSGFRQLSEISRLTRMIEDHLLIKFFEIRAHEKKRVASRRISNMRSISSMVL